MFSKTFKIKSTNTLKNTEKKQLASRIQANVNATEERAKELVPNKSNASCMKVMLHSGELVSVYVIDNWPIVIEARERCYPTVCALWKVPDLVPTITIHVPVLSKLQNGVPLYAPGVSGTWHGGTFRRGAVIAVNTDNNTSAAAVGIAAMDSTQMLSGHGGVAMEPIHVFGDYLCKECKFNKIERPTIPPPAISTFDMITTDIKQLSLSEAQHDEFPPLVPPPPMSYAATAAVSAHSVPNTPQIIHAQTNTPMDTTQCNNEQHDEAMECSRVPTDMDALLKYSLLTFLKCDGKSVQLPLKTNLLYRNYLIAYCPSSEVTLDVKKSSYKKVGKFLEAMQKEGLIEVKEIEKGVDAITSVNVAHVDVRAHTAVVIAKPMEAIDDGDKCEYVPPQVKEMYCVTAAVMQLFAPLKKGTAVTAAQVRETLTKYVKCNNLQTANGQITINALLSQIIGRQEQVTLVSNLESYGLTLSELCKVCQVGVAASCCVTKTPGAKYDQLLLQGDQTYFMAKLLIEKYGLPKKYVEGADKALKKKNK